MAIIKRGYNAVKQEKERQEEEKSKRNGQLFRFYLAKDGDEADIRFLTEEPITFYEHTRKTTVNGKERYETVTCSGEPDCPDCMNGSRPTFKGAYLVIDRRVVKSKKDGKEVEYKDQLRLFVQGTRVLSQLDRLSQRGGISNRELTIVRLGSGTSTTYTLEKGDENKLSKQEIEQLLPEYLRSKFDGTMESLYSIVEEQVTLNLPNGSAPTEEDTTPTNYNGADKIVVADEPKEEEQPKRTLKKFGIPKKENSVKARLKALK